MNPHLNRLAVVAIAAVTAFGVAGCGKGLFGDDKSDDGTIKLGMAVPLSGGSAAIGPYMRNGAQLAVDELNSKGGVLGRKLQLLVEDDACEASAATNAANKLVSAGVVASVGGYCSGATLPTLSVFARRDIPMVIPAANSNELVAQKLKNVFLINGSGTHQATAALTFIEKSGAQRVAVVHDNTSYSKDIAVLTEKALDAPGGPEKVLVEAITPKESDYSGAVTKVLGNRPDFIYFTGYFQEGGLLIRQLRQAGYAGKLMVADGAVDDSLATIAGGQYAEGVFATMTYTPQVLQGAEAWISAYKQKFGADPGPYAPQSYDAVRIVAEAIKNANSTDGKKVIAALEAIDGFPVFSGPLKFAPDHTLTAAAFVILVVKSGKFALADRLTDPS